MSLTHNFSQFQAEYIQLAFRDDVTGCYAEVPLPVYYNSRTRWAARGSPVGEASDRHLHLQPKALAVPAPSPSLGPIPRGPQGSGELGTRVAVCQLRRQPETLGTLLSQLWRLQAETEAPAGWILGRALFCLQMATFPMCPHPERELASYQGSNPITRPHLRASSNCQYVGQGSNVNVRCTQTFRAGLSPHPDPEPPRWEESRV